MTRKALAIWGWRELTKPVDAIVTVSHECKRVLSELLHVDPSKLFVVHHGVDHKLFRPIERQLALDYIVKKYNVKLNIKCKIVLHLSVYALVKNVELIIMAIHGLRKSGTQVTLLLAGPGHQERFGRIVSEDPHLRGHVIFIPFVKEEDLPYIYCAADIAVYPSWHEGFGMPVLEAMSCARPVITSDIPTFHEIAGECGIYVPQTDYKTLSRRILELLNDPVYAESLGRELYIRSLNFSWDKTARETAAVYRNCLS